MTPDTNTIEKNIPDAIPDREEFTLTISKDSFYSTDKNFDINNLSLGDGYKPLDAYFKPSDGNIIKRKLNKGERRITNQTLPRLSFQVFEKNITELSEWDRENFPICKYSNDSELISGIYLTHDEYEKKNGNGSGYSTLTYSRENGPQFIIYSWNVFSTIFFVQECLKRFGNEGASFVLEYRRKDKEDEPKQVSQTLSNEKLDKDINRTFGYKNPYSRILFQSKNIILRGAPGTGKSFLAKEIAADIISNGYTDNYSSLSAEEKQQVEFVQFHPGYDYSDFVEGLRPKMNEDGSIGFELQSGIFKRFVEKARKNLEDSQKTKESIQQEVSARAAMEDFFSNIEFGTDKFKTLRGSEYTITDIDDKHIYLYIPGNEFTKKLTGNIDELLSLLESDIEFKKIRDIKRFFNKEHGHQIYSYYYPIVQEIRKCKHKYNAMEIPLVQRKNYIFIIDEINRGEISKIFGELFFSIDPGYRGISGSVSTQYSNMHSDREDTFYIPENVYIIGTMNDIDRSVDSFDFAMRRRFRFIEIKPEDTQSMLEAVLGDSELKRDAIRRMDSLNKAICEVPDLNENYQIGASYFLNVQEVGFDSLWTDYLLPLLQDYVRGLYGEHEILAKFARAYGYTPLNEGGSNETA